MKKLLSLSLVLAVLALGILVAPAAAQQPTNGVLSGFVKYTNGDPVKNRCIRLRDLDTNGVVGESRTDDQGAYRFTGLAPAVYAVEVLKDDCTVPPVAMSQKAPLTAQLPSVSGVIVTLAAEQAAGAAAAGGSFFTSTAGIITLAAAGAGAGIGIYEAAKDKKVTICHNGQTITVSESAWPSHQAHGDTLGPCPASPVR